MAKEGITPRAKDYAQWYLDIFLGADLADYAKVVRGCHRVQADRLCFNQQQLGCAGITVKCSVTIVATSSGAPRIPGLLVAF
jgi:hypothetical protein